MNEFEKQVEHLATLAMTLGWWAYSSQRSQELEAEKSQAFAGLRSAIKLRLQQAKFRPDPHELRG